MSNILFTTNKNYMKRDSSSGSDTMLGPDTLYWDYGRDYVIEHNLGYVPIFRVYYEPFGDGKIVEAFHDSQAYVTDPLNEFGGSADGPTCWASADENNLTITLYYQDDTLQSTEFPIYWVIYKDYGVEE